MTNRRQTHLRVRRYHARGRTQFGASHAYSSPSWVDAEFDSFSQYLTVMPRERATAPRDDREQAMDDMAGSYYNHILRLS